MSSKPIVVRHSFSVQPDAVWQAVTRPELMRQWYFEPIEDFHPEVGFETQFDIETGGRIFRHRWKVTEVVPGTSITYTGGSGTQFVLLKSADIGASLSSWTRVATNSTTPYSFTIPAVGTPPSPAFFSIKSE